jgi:DNA-binding GntR family transcriptional regulator
LSMWPKQMLEVSSLKDEVKDQIRDAILTGVLQPGARIVETQIARMFGISQVPVREALRGLEEEGLVRTVKYKGAYVSELVLDEIYHSFLLRSQVESGALDVVVPKLESVHFDELNNIVEQMRAVKNDDSYVVHSGLDVLFHSRIIEWAGVDIYMRIWNLLNGHVRRFITLMHPTYFSDNHVTVVKQHEELVTILQTKDVMRAKKAFIEHIMHLWNVQGIMNP